MSTDLSLDAIFQRLWADYERITPQATRIHGLLEARGEKFRNDHIAFRTYNLPTLNLEKLAAPFLERGYVQSGTYVFKQKKLDARSYSHPSGQYPRVFISELRTEAFSQEVQGIIKNIVSRVNSSVSGIELLLERPTWPAVRLDEYETLLEVSEFAAWLSAFGIRANHFTVSFNDLKRFASMSEFADFLSSEGFSLNSAAKPILGSPAELFEQFSTRAEPIEWTFANAVKKEIPSCYYEFARRYVDPSTNQMFDGFLTDNADKIFESTNVRSV